LAIPFVIGSLCGLSDGPPSISLIPKVQGVVAIKDFKPNVVPNFKFKVMSKILANRLGIVCSKVIFHNQNDFIRGCLIKGCICIASEPLTCCQKMIRVVMLLLRSIYF